MSPASIPEPSVMPLDREAWKQQLNLSQFVNTYYQYRDVVSCVGEDSSILIIGPGAGLDALILRWKGFNVTTFDIDETFNPDVKGSCHDMPMFSDKQFDVVIASHVLEHLPLSYLDQALCEISRICRFAIFYFPMAGKHTKLELKPKVGNVELSIVIDLIKFWEKPDGMELKYRGGQHYWEIGYRGFRVKEIKKKLEPFYEVLNDYRNKDWLPSYNFVLRSKNKSLSSS